ncbi:MAG: hypothetical protein IRZ09_05065 [Variibacter sp.]|nr:hypothetical protein [Variibacter sp.]
MTLAEFNAIQLSPRAIIVPAGTVKAGDARGASARWVAEPAPKAKGAAGTAVRYGGAGKKH